jgi:Leucine-rich repeat (LRR) protein
MGNRLTTTAALEKYPNVLRAELSKNRIADFSALSRLRKLQRVVLSDNDIKEFPQELCAVPSLREVTIN